MSCESKLISGNNYFSIGEASKLCNLSKKALRYYDELGLLSPDVVGESGYRYYSRETLLRIPVLKYFKQMGFTLEQMKDFVNGSSYPEMLSVFKKQVEDLLEENQRINEQATSVSDWYDLIIEANSVIELNSVEVAVKYVNAMDYCCLDQPYNPCHMDAIINIEFTNFIESIDNEITGPVWRRFDSWREKVENKVGVMKMIQKAIRPVPPEHAFHFEGGMMLSCYHIGAHGELGRTYEKIAKWASIHGYKLFEGSYERYVTDYWTTLDQEKHVTEVLIGTSR